MREPGTETGAAGHLPGQGAIWSHYQNDDQTMFKLAGPRLDALAREAGRRNGGPGRVLTIGVGDGYLERRLSAGGWTVTALDPDERSVERLVAEGIDAHTGLIQALPFSDGAFDVAIASEVLEHLDPPTGAAGVAELRRVVRPGGCFLGTVPAEEDLSVSIVACPCCGEVFHRWGHLRSFDSTSLRQLLAGPFTTVRITTTAFVEVRGRGPVGAVKSSVRWVLGRMGQQIASPHLAFAAS